LHIRQGERVGFLRGPMLAPFFFLEDVARSIIRVIPTAAEQLNDSMSSRSRDVERQEQEDVFVLRKQGLNISTGRACRDPSEMWRAAMSSVFTSWWSKPITGAVIDAVGSTAW